MPANLTPQYHEAEEQFKKATSDAEKISALEEMLRTLPKHKGTEKMQADLKKRLSRLRKEGRQKSTPGASHRPFYSIDREGIGRVVLCGPPNSGKSKIVDQLTSARPEVADFPFTTRMPQPGMMPFEDVQIQLIDMPPLAPETVEAWQLAMIEQADVAVVVFDVLDPHILEQTDFLKTQFQARGIPLEPTGKPNTVVLANKMDLAGAAENRRVWQELFVDSFSALPFSALSSENLESLRTLLFKRLDVVRVYTKAPGKKPEKNPTPYVLKRGSTVLQAAALIHRDLVERFKFARVWGNSRFDGAMVERDYLLEDGDLLEIHT